MPFEPFISSIEIFPKGNFLVRRRGVDEISFKNPYDFTYSHYRYIDGILKENREFLNSDYERISSNIIKFVNHTPILGVEALYDVELCRFISPKFTKIRKFEKTSFGEYAEAYVARIIMGELLIIATCHIGKNGNLLGTIWNNVKNENIDPSGSDFDFSQMLEEIEKQYIEKLQAKGPQKLYRFKIVEDLPW